MANAPSGNSHRPWREQQWRVLGMWEPRMFLIRRGDGAAADVDAMWRHIHSDDELDRWQSLGVNLVHIYLHKGYGLEHESESIGNAASFAERLHARGIRVGVYIGCTFFYETFRHPEYDRMVMVNAHSGWSGAQYFRKHWCWNSPPARAYVEQVIRVALNEVKADVLHFDQSWSFHQDRLCHCESCLNGFRDFLAERPDILRAAGYDRPEHLLPPPVGNLEYVASVREAKEPGAMAWLLYHSRAGVEAMRYFTEFARSVRPDVGILYNGANLCGIPEYARADDEIEKLYHADMTAVEDSLENPPGLTDDGMPVSRFRPYKAGLRVRCRTLSYTVDKGLDNRLMLAEAAAFSYNSLGFVAMVQQENHRIESPEDEALLKWLVANEDLFLDREPWHQVAVLRHHESTLLNPFPCALTPYVLEQMLFERHVAFGIVGERDLKAETLLREFSLLILPDSKCLSDGEVREIEAFVRQGGRLLSIGLSGLATPFNQYRSAWALGAIFGRRDKPTAVQATYEEIAASIRAATTSAPNTVRIEAAFGSGRAAHLGPLRFRIPPGNSVHSFSGYPWYYHPWWRAPENGAELLDALDGLLGEETRIDTDLPRHVGIECYRAAEGYRLCLVNFAHPETAPASRIGLRLNSDGPIRQVEWTTPETTQQLSWCGSGERVEIATPPFPLLAVLRLNGG